MSSRTQQKTGARRRRLEQERASAQSARRKRRMQLLAGTVVIAVVVIAAVIVISVGGGSTGAGLAKGRASQKLSAQVDAMLAGIPEHGTTLGDQDAKSTLTFFGDLQCPICASLATGQDGGGLPRFINDQVRTGHAKIVYRSFCTATCNAFPQSLFDQQQAAAYAAGNQNRFWYYEQLFYRQQGTEGTPYVNPAFLQHLARQIPGLNYSTWRNDRDNPELLTRVQSDGRAAITQLPLVNGGRGTPGLIVSGPKGRRLVAEGLVGYSQLQAALKSVS
jgi:protein-disulfide isomerase